MKTAPQANRAVPARPAPEPIAIIGMACLFPQAPDLASFWRNIVNGVDAIGAPVESWDAQRYLDSGRIKTASGGYLKDLFRFDPREFGIMPNSLDGGEPDQFLALAVASDALRDAGYLSAEHDHRDTGIVLGHSTYLHRGQGAILQNTLVLDQTMELLQIVCPELEPAKLAEVRVLLKKKMPQSNADIAPSLVPNVMTGRIANRLNLKGPNYLLDAACSSSLLAVNAAIDELRGGRSRMMLAGGVNASLPAEVAVIFTQLGALTGRGKVRPFETGSDGTLLGEGLGVVVLKKLADAIGDGDRVYAVIRGIGQASDGRGHGLLAPSVDGETLAIRRAYDGSGVDPASVSLIEAHGTGIPLGDKTEIAALKNVFGSDLTPQGAMAIGSVKSMISHCIPAAGIAGLIKTAMALHHKTLPPTLCDAVNPELGIQDTPFYVNTRTSPWISRVGGVRRAGIDSFGFGGINTHAILEEAPASAARPPKSTPWPAELCVLSADSVASLSDKLQRLASTIEQVPTLRLPEIAAALSAADDGGRCRLALVAKDRAMLAKSIEQAVVRLRDKPTERWSTRAGIVYSSAPLEGKLAFLFPGEGSQFTGMLGDLALCFGEVQSWLDFWHSLYDEPRGENRTDIVFPPPTGLSDARREQLEARLHDMDVGSEAVFVGGQAMHALLRSLGVKPDVMLGHSSGESSALAASGAIAAESTQDLAQFIRQLNAAYERVLAAGEISTGALLAVGALTSEAVEAHIAATSKEVVVAMDNCANQLVLYGKAEAIAALQKVLSDAGAICLPLPFDRGYHTPAFAAVSAVFLAYYRSIRMGCPRVPMYSCASADLFPGTAAAVRRLASEQWSTKVRFRETVLKMHADGVRYFVEVGPSGNLTAFVNDILAGKDHVSVASNLRRRNGVEQLLTLLAQLYVNAKPVEIGRLFDDRGIAAVDLAEVSAAPVRGVLLDNTMPVLRFSQSDRGALQRLTAAAVAPAVRPDSRTTPAADEPARQPMGDPVEAELGHDPRIGVMAEYFDVMRGFLDQQCAVVQSWQGSAAEGEPEDPVVDPGMCFLNDVLEHTADHLVALCHLSLNDNFLKSHVLSGRVSETDPELSGLACVPLMVSLEIMVQACVALTGNTVVCVIENVRAFDWIALDDGEVTLEVRAERVDADGRVCRAALFNGVNRVVSAEFHFEPVWQLTELDPLGEVQASRWSDSELYSTGMFHGPVFQSVRQIEGWNEAGIDAQLSNVSLADFFIEGRTPRLVLNPVLLDALGQLAAYWVAQRVGTDFNCFPSTIERIELYAPCPADLPGLRLRARQHPVDSSATDISASRSWRFECVDAAGRPLLRVSKLVNIFFAVPHTFYQVRRDPLHGLLGQPHVIAAPRGVTLWQVAHYPEDFCTQSGGIFLRILAHALLSFDEREEWRTLAGSARRRREWLLGRATIKESVRVVLLERSGQLLYPSDITVMHDELGAPYVDGWWRGQLADAPSVSLSHTSRGCMVAVGASAVGVDFEDLGRIQQPELIIDTLTPIERDSIRGLNGAALDERLLRLWCAKEATAKFLGIGLQGRPEAFEVRFADDSFVEAFVGYEDSITRVSLARDGQTVIAVAADEHNGIEVH